MTRMLVGSVAVATALITSAGSAFATECTNADKPVDAGVQVVVGPNGVVWATPGLEKRFGKGLVDPATGEGFHGLVGIDLDGDGKADFSTYVVGPDMEIPETAQFNGPACHGIVHLEDFLQDCVQ